MKKEEIYHISGDEVFSQDLTPDGQLVLVVDVGVAVALAFVRTVSVMANTVGYERLKKSRITVVKNFPDKCGLLSSQLVEIF